MLILTRTFNEGLVIDEDVTLTILSVKGNQVRFGVTAPKDKKIHRKELFEKIFEDREAKKIRS
ncbi:MAG: carbon storage regulator CsrA [Cellvibrionales bacterium]|nr:carbon storage regulator CsrA [Cellvibrionales bacterium]